MLFAHISSLNFIFLQTTCNPVIFFRLFRQISCRMTNINCTAAENMVHYSRMFQRKKAVYDKKTNRKSYFAAHSSDLGIFVCRTDNRHGACAAVYVHGHSYRARRTGFDSRYFVPAAHAIESAAPCAGSTAAHRPHVPHRRHLLRSRAVYRR